jgi:hypothetical protein
MSGTRSSRLPHKGSDRGGVVPKAASREEVNVSVSTPEDDRPWVEPEVEEVPEGEDEGEQEPEQ